MRAALADRFAPEHLEIATADPEALLARRCAMPARSSWGATRPRRWAIIIAGPNHVLPTSRTARFSSGLSVLDFMKRTTLLALDAKPHRRARARGHRRLAEAEGLEAHARSIAARLNRKD